MGPIVNPSNGHTYFRLTPSKWTEAETEARTLGGHLVTVDDLQEHNWVFSTFSQAGQYGLWIGINDATRFGQYTWSSGVPVTYTNWAPRQPDHFTHRTGEIERYGMIFVEEGGRPSANTGRWNDFANVAVENATVDGSGGVLQGVVEVDTVKPDLAATSLAWNTAQGGVDYTYTIGGADLTGAANIGLYWSADAAFDPGLDTLVPGSVTTTQTARGSYAGHVAPSALTVPPPGARNLLVVVDGGNSVGEADEANNVAAWRSNLGGLAWLQAEGVSQLDGQGKYSNSQQVSDLAPSFRPKVEAFIAALTQAGATVSITSTRRDPNRAYLMHYAWDIAHGIDAPANVPARAGIDIRWDYGDLALSRQAAQQMVDFFGMTNAAALDSRHIQGLAIDMQVTWTGVLRIRNRAGRLVDIATGPRDANNVELARVAATYGVFRNFTDNAPHWSSDGR